MSLMQTYSRYPLTLVKGKGSYVWDDQGEQYLDFTAGIATCNLGHVPDYVYHKVQAQLENLWHCSNLYHIPTQEQLAALLVEHSCADQVFFGNSGAEANEGAIKLARKYGKAHKCGNAYHVVTFNQSFHGRTLATLSATGQSKIQTGFTPLVEGFSYLPYNDIDALKQIVPEQTAAIMLELVQGEGGVINADSNWIRAVSDYCHEHDILLMVDEVQTGMGRTGKLFAYQHYGIEPDVITLAKGLGSGFPIGAILAKDHVAQYFEPGSHGSTFGGNPLATTAGLATLEYMIQEQVPEQVTKTSQYLVTQLHKLQDKYPVINDVRGLGLLCGLEVGAATTKVVANAREHKLLLLSAGAHVVRILPPLVVTYKEIDEAVNILDKVFSALEV